MAAVNSNTGNSYISYFIKGLLGKANAVKKLAGISNIWLEHPHRQADQSSNRYSHVLLFCRTRSEPIMAITMWDELNEFVREDPHSHCGLWLWEPTV